MSDPEASRDMEPQLTVVKGDPTDAELAAVFVVWAAQRAAERAKLASRAPTPDDARSGWSAYWRSVRTPLRPGPGVWQLSERP